MASKNQLERYGIFTREDFLPSSLCNHLCRAIDAAPLKSGALWSAEKGPYFEDQLKRRKEFSYIATDHPDVHQRIFGIADNLTEYFGLRPTALQPLKFTRYDVGDFYKPHRDLVDNDEAAQEINARKIAVTLFLNQQGDEPDEGDYCGGNLTFYGLINDPAWQSVGMPLDSEEGMLVAFRPDIVHEVTPVTRGTRYAITTWLE